MFEPIARRLRQWHLRSITRRKLALLDDRLLADMGVNPRDPGDCVVPLPIFSVNR